MKNWQYFLLSLTVLFPWIAGLVRYKSMRRMYRPFILLITIAVATEIISRITISYFKNNNATINIYSLIEYILIITQFYFWRYYSRTRRWYPWFGLLCVIIWIVENLILGDVIVDVGPVFRVSSSFIVVILSINEINYLIIHENRNLLKNARFLICTGFLIYFLYEVLLEGSIYISSKEENSTASKIIQLSMYINVLVNIIYGIAVCFIPKRSAFSFDKNKNPD
ncbi:MAG: hypothetical protein ABI480_10745 [Chitinophagaceae bacterium]